MTILNLKSRKPLLWIFSGFAINVETGMREIFLRKLCPLKWNTTWVTVGQI